LVPKIAKGISSVSGVVGDVSHYSVESGRWAPYGCEFCTVTGFFGAHPVSHKPECVDELLLLKARARTRAARIAVFFIDDNFAINSADEIAAARHYRRRAQVHWVGKIAQSVAR